MGKMNIWDHRNSDACLRCGEQAMAGHILSFWDDAAVKVFHDFIELMDEWMVKVDTVPEVRKAIKQALLFWKEGHRLSLPHSD